MNNTACAYIRVSTDEQTEYSPDAQLNAIKKYVKENNLILPSEYIFTDEGYSGRKAEKRPAFMKMISTAKLKPTPFSTILIHKFDRFARNREDSVVYKSLLKKECNIKVISVTESIEDDKFSIILESMLEAMAEYYSLNLAEEVKKGMVEKAKRGEYQAFSPFGYDNDKINKTLTVNDKEAKIVKYIFEEFLKSTPIQQITKNINSMNILTKRGNKFERRTIEYILKNSVYMGYTTWCEDGNKNNHKTNINNIYTVKGNYPAIISNTDFQKVQCMIAEYKQKCIIKSRPITEFKHYLSSTIKCNNCNSSLSMGKKYTQCIGYSHGKCNVSNSISIEKLENIFISELKYISELKFHNLKIKVKLKDKDKLNSLKLKINRLKLRLQRARTAYLDGIESLEDYKETKLLTEISINELENELKNISNTKKFDEMIFCENPPDPKSIISNENITNSEKSECIKKSIEKIVYKKDNKILEFYFNL